MFNNITIIIVNCYTIDIKSLCLFFLKFVYVKKKFLDFSNKGREQVRMEDQVLVFITAL